MKEVTGHGSLGSGSWSFLSRCKIDNMKVLKVSSWSVAFYVCYSRKTLGALHHPLCRRGANDAPIDFKAQDNPIHSISSYCKSWWCDVGKCWSICLGMPQLCRIYRRHSSHHVSAFEENKSEGKSQWPTDEGYVAQDVENECYKMRRDSKTVIWPRQDLSTMLTFCLSAIVLFTDLPTPCSDKTVATPPKLALIKNKKEYDRMHTAYETKWRRAWSSQISS